MKVKEFIENVIFQTCEHFGIEREVFLCRTRGPYSDLLTYSEIRYIAMDLCRQLPEQSIPYETLGKFFERDHASVLHGTRKTANLRKTSKQFELHYKQIEKKVNESLRLQ